MSLKTKLLLLIAIAIAGSVGTVALLIEERAHQAFRQIEQERTALLVGQFHREFEHEGDEIIHGVETIANSDSMLRSAMVTEPKLFAPHPHLDDRINHNIIQSEIEGGVFLYELPPGTVLEVETQNRVYRLECCGHASAWISGHPAFCPQAVVVDVHGSTWGGTMLKMHFIGRGMHLEFSHPEHGLILTSRITDIREVNCVEADGSGTHSYAYRN